MELGVLWHCWFQDSGILREHILMSAVSLVQLRGPSVDAIIADDTTPHRHDVEWMVARAFAPSCSSN